MRLLAALVLVLLSAVHAVSSSTVPLSASNLRAYGSPLVLRHRPHVYPAISSPAPRSDILQTLDEHVYPWALQGSSQGLLSAQAATEAALSRTLFFDDYPHERALASYITFRREQGLPDIRLGSIRFSSPFLLPL